MNSRPDWVMCGASLPDGRVMILASTELEQAELETRRDDFDLYGSWRPHREPRRRTSLTVEMRGYVMVTADTYEQALRALFEQWSPQRTERPQVGGGQAQITAEGNPL